MLYEHSFPLVLYVFSKMAYKYVILFVNLFSTISPTSTCYIEWKWVVVISSLRYIVWSCDILLKLCISLHMFILYLWILYLSGGHFPPNLGFSLLFPNIQNKS